MRVLMSKTSGVFEVGKTYNVSRRLAEKLVALHSAMYAESCREDCSCTKNMKPGQVLKGGLESQRT